MLLAPVDGGGDCVYPVVAAPRARRRVGKGIELQGQESRGAQPALRDLVSGERLSRQGIVGNGRRAVGDAGPAEVPGAFRRGGDEGGPGDSTRLPAPFLGGEEVELVLDDGPAYGPAEVVHAQGCFGLARLLQEVVLRGQGIVAAEVVAAAVELVRAAAGDDVHLGSGRSSELRAVAVPVDLELVDGVHRGEDENGAVGAHVVVVGTVHRPHVAAEAAAADGELDARHQAPILRIEPVPLADPGHEGAELEEVAAVQGKLTHLLSRDQARDLGPRGRDLDRVRLHRDLFADGTRRQHDVDGPHVGDVQGDVRDHRRFEPAEPHLDLVAAHGQLGEREDPGRVRGGGSAEAGVFALERHLGSRHDASGRVLDRAADGGREPLGQGGQGGDEDEQQGQGSLAHGLPPG